MRFVEGGPNPNPNPNLKQFVRFLEGDPNPNPNPNPNPKQFVRFLEGDRAALSEHLTDQQQQLGQLQAPIVRVAAAAARQWADGFGVA